MRFISIEELVRAVEDCQGYDLEKLRKDITGKMPWYSGRINDCFNYAQKRQESICEDVMSFLDLSSHIRGAAASGRLTGYF